MEERTYVLDSHGQPRLEKDPQVWYEWLTSDAAKPLILVDMTRMADQVVVLTHFVGLAANPRYLWETTLLTTKGAAGKLNRAKSPLKRKCGGSREQAEAMHAKAIADVQRVVKVYPDVALP